MIREWTEIETGKTRKGGVRGVGGAVVREW